MLEAAQALKLRQRAEAGESRAALARKLGISQETLYRYLASKEKGDPKAALIPLI